MFGRNSQTISTRSMERTETLHFCPQLFMANIWWTQDLNDLFGLLEFIPTCEGRRTIVRLSHLLIEIPAPPPPPHGEGGAIPHIRGFSRDSPPSPPPPYSFPPFTRLARLADRRSRWRQGCWGGTSALGAWCGAWARARRPGRLGGRHMCVPPQNGGIVFDPWPLVLPLASPLVSALSTCQPTFAQLFSQPVLAHSDLSPRLVLTLVHTCLPAVAA